MTGTGPNVEQHDTLVAPSGNPSCLHTTLACEDKYKISKLLINGKVIFLVKYITQITKFELLLSKMPIKIPNLQVNYLLNFKMSAKQFPENEIIVKLVVAMSNFNDF